MGGDVGERDGLADDGGGRPVLVELDRGDGGVGDVVGGASELRVVGEGVEGGEVAWGQDAEVGGGGLERVEAGGGGGGGGGGRWLGRGCEGGGEGDNLSGASDGEGEVLHAQQHLHVRRHVYGQADVAVSDDAVPPAALLLERVQRRVEQRVDVSDSSDHLQRVAVVRDGRRSDTHRLHPLADRGHDRGRRCDEVVQLGLAHPLAVRGVGGVGQLRQTLLQDVEVLLGE